MARGSLHSLRVQLQQNTTGLVFSWVCTINARLVRLHLSCDFSASFFFCPLFAAVVSTERFFYKYTKLLNYSNASKCNSLLSTSAADDNEPSLQQNNDG